jgi:hypothetical protein
LLTGAALFTGDAIAGFVEIGTLALALSRKAREKEISRWNPGYKYLLNPEP